MSDKKGLSAFINKNKKTKKPKAKQEETTQKEVDDAQEAQVIAKTEETKKNTPVQNDSSDEEVDELEIATKQIDNVNIKENKDVGGGKHGDDKKKGFGYEDDQAQQNETSKKQAGKKFGDGAMTFSRPTFARKNKIGNRGDFDAGLDDLDDDNTDKKDSKKQQNDGQREFVNLGSTARTGHEQVEQKKEAVKPTFRGKLNLAKTGGQPDEENQGVIKDYDFRNVYKGARDENEERKQGDGSYSRGGGNRGRGRRGGRGTDFNDRNNDEDEGFEMITAGKRKAKKTNDDSSSEDESRGYRGGRGGFQRGGRREGGFIQRNTESEQIRGARVERGGNRGGRGGFD